MASEEQVMQIINKYRESCPDNFWKKNDTTNVGLGAVIRCLMKHDGQATSGQISDEINVSTARVAALLKKMEQREWIIREKDPNDQRVTVVKLSQSGLEVGLTMRNNIHQEIAKLIDELGEEKLIDFMETRAKIFAIVDHSKFCIH